MTYRLALDLGATSLGWCVLSLDSNNNPTDILDMGVRIFPDGRDAQKKEPLAVERRGARGARRRRDRLKRRQKRLMATLINNGLMPEAKQERKALEEKDPYELRARAAEKKVSLHELGRALFHINQRRGFKSNRKTDKGENEGGAIKAGIAALEQEMMAANVTTLGQYLYQQHKSGGEVRARPEAKGNQNEYPIYPAREMYENEVSCILAEQQKHHPELTDEVCEQIRDRIFFQRSLLPQDVGRCTFETDQPRAKLAYPEVQRFRILQEVNSLAVDELNDTDPRLSPEDRQKIINKLSNVKELKFGGKKGIRGLLNFGDEVKFNLEAGENRKGLEGDSTSTELAKADKFGDEWHQLTYDQQNEVIDWLIDCPEEDEAINWLQNTHGLIYENAKNAANARLKDGYGRLSLKAIRNILPFLEQGYIYSDACENAGYHHSDRRTGEVYNHLPYYGAVLPEAVIGGSFDDKDAYSEEKYYGKINNPSVHIALNQLRKLVNAVIDTYGEPREISIELARELKFGQQRYKEHQQQLQKDRQRNERINAELDNIGITPNYQNRLKYKLWEELADDPSKRCCPFTGKQISLEELFHGPFEVEHLLPFAYSYDDSPANKVISHQSANRLKANQSPYQAFGHSPDHYDWEAILARAENLPKNKRWRFKPDAWEIAERGTGGMIARQLTDTQYMSRIAKRYLSFVVPEQPGESRVYGIPGQLTALLRRKWGLNNLLDDEAEQKDRNNHRHHAVDAFVVGCTTRSMLQAISREANKMLTDDQLFERRQKLAESFPEPFLGFRDQLRHFAENMVISYKPDHGNAQQAAQQGDTIAALHKDTAYGLAGPGDPKKGTNIYVTRKGVTDMVKRRDLEAIADPQWRQTLLNAVEGCSDNSKDFKAAIADAAKRYKLRRLRVHVERRPETMVPVYHPDDKGNPDAQPFKYYDGGGNYAAEIYMPKQGKDAGKWGIEIITNFEAHQPNHTPQWKRDYPGARKIMRLQIDDMVAFEDQDGVTVIRRVRKLNAEGRIVLVDPVRSNLGNNEGWTASVHKLQQHNARKISIDIMGRVRDPYKRIPFRPVDATYGEEAA